MATQEIPLHYICTPAQARRIAAEQDEFFLANCGCRESRGSCARSRVDVCLWFHRTTAGGSPSIRTISWDEVEAVLLEAKQKRLVSRPFRGMEDRTVTEGICFCCDDCCGYFLNPTERCDKGVMIERTDREACNDCADCVEVCHFGARAIEAGSGKLAVDQERCYGCGLCADACTLDAIEMVRRE